MPEYTLRVNGEAHDVSVPAEMPLLWVLRDILGLTGTKYGCGISRCGACTVHVDGEPTRSCRARISAVGDSEVTTVEGLGGAGLHPVQEAWIAEEVPQCGYCQPGMVMTAAGLHATSAASDDAAIDQELGGHICRCGTYDRIRRAIHRAAGEG